LTIEGLRPIKRHYFNSVAKCAAEFHFPPQKQTLSRMRLARKSAADKAVEGGIGHFRFFSQRENIFPLTE